MRIEVEGIVLRRTKYGEGSMIADLLTPDHEILTVITSGLNSKKGQHRSVLLQPGMPVVCVLYYKESGNMHRLKDVSSGTPLENIPFSVEKGSVLLFMIELMRNTIGKSGSDDIHYQFLYNEINKLDQRKEGIRYFSLQFAIQLSQIMGFGPNLQTYSPNSYFDMFNGIFTEKIPAHPHYFSEKYTVLFYEFCSDIDSPEPHRVSIGKKDRRFFMDHIMQYYKLHIDHFKIPNAQKVLATVFDS